MSELALTKGERRVLEGAAHCHQFGWNFCTGRSARKADAKKLVERGLLEDGGLAVVVDGDGFAIEPERYRPSYKLTEAGHAEHARLEREAMIDFLVRFVADTSPADLANEEYVGDLKEKAAKLGEPWENILAAAAKSKEAA